MSGLKILKRPVNILISYHYFKTSDIAVIRQRKGDRLKSLFLDSGAFTAFTQGYNIDIDEYINWIHDHDEHFDLIANLDVIGNAKQTWHNQEIMKSNEIDAIPVFHIHSEFDWLKKYIDAGYQYIGLGVAGHHLRNINNTISWLIKVFQIGAEAGVDFHGFGITSYRILQKFKWKSVDSSTWGKSFRYGQVCLFDQGKMFNYKIGDKQIYQHGRLVREHDVEPETLVDREKNTRLTNKRVNMNAYLNMEEYIKTLNPKFTLYLTDGNLVNLMVDK